MVLSTELKDSKDSKDSRDSKADVSSVSPSSERIEELRVMCGLYTEGGATLLAGMVPGNVKNKKIN